MSSVSPSNVRFGLHLVYRLIYLIHDGVVTLTFFFQAEDGIRDKLVTGVQTCALPILSSDVFIRVMDEFQKASTPIITCCSASLKIGAKIAEQKMQYVFQLSPTAKDVATSVIAAVATLEKPSKVVMLNENTDAGRDFSQIGRASCRERV